MSDFEFPTYEWTDAPPPPAGHTDGHRKRLDWRGFAGFLRANPGRWVKVSRDDTDGGNAAVYGKRLRDMGCEAVVRDYALYVRWPATQEVVA